MKKNFLIFALTFISYYSFAQDYISIKQEQTTYFENIKTIRIDSVTSSSDTIFYHNFRMMRESSEIGCYNRFGASWTGQSIIILPNSYNLFVNKTADTISIKTNAVLNEQWLFYTYLDGRTITASISEHTIESFLGIEDEVKTINLQVKDADGNNLEDDINYKYLKLSKNYGLVRILDFYEFPYETEADRLYNYLLETNIIGIGNLGYQNYGAKEIFDYSIDDELHIHEYQYGGPYTAADDKFFIYKVIEEDSSENIITYTYDRCYKRVHNDYNNPENSFTSFTHDTVTTTYNFMSDNLQELGNISCEPFLVDEYYWSFLKGKTRCDDIFDGDNLECLSMAIFDPYVCYNYNKGLGGPYYIGCGFTSPPCGRDLAYFKKGEIEHGNPYICGQLASINIQTSGIKIYPNPAQNFIIIEYYNTNNQQVKIEIGNILGKNVIQTTSNNQQTRINITQLKKGVYFIHIKSGEKSYTKKFIKN